MEQTMDFIHAIMQSLPSWRSHSLGLLKQFFSPFKAYFKGVIFFNIEIWNLRSSKSRCVLIVTLHSHLTHQLWATFDFFLGCMLTQLERKRTSHVNPGESDQYCGVQQPFLEWIHENRGDHGKWMLIICIECSQAVLHRLDCACELLCLTHLMAVEYQP